MPKEEEMIRRIDHIELVVKDLDKSVGFFKELGFREIRRTSHHGTSVELAIPGEGQPVWELHRVTGDEVIGINHIGFHVDDVNQEYQRLKDGGIELQGEPHLIESTGRILLDFRDPTGFRYHLVQSSAE
jgi:lactoylglutathione lyase